MEFYIFNTDEKQLATNKVLQKFKLNDILNKNINVNSSLVVRVLTSIT